MEGPVAFNDDVVGRAPPPPRDMGSLFDFNSNIGSPDVFHFHPVALPISPVLHFMEQLGIEREGAHNVHLFGIAHGQRALCKYFHSATHGLIAVLRSFVNRSALGLGKSGGREGGQDEE